MELALEDGFAPAAPTLRRIIPRAIPLETCEPGSGMTGRGFGRHTGRHGDPHRQTPEARPGLRPTSRMTDSTSSSSTVAAALGGLTVALDLCAHRWTQPQPADHNLFGKLVHSVLDRGVQVPEGLEQAERDECGNGGFRHGTRRGT